MRSLGSNNIGRYHNGNRWVATPEGSAALAEALKVNETLKELRYAANLPNLANCQQPLTLLRARPCRSVCHNDITGEGAEQLAKAVLEHTVLTDFCSIPLASLRSNSVTELDLKEKGIGVPGAIVLAALLPSATALTSLKCATPCPLSPKVSAAADTFVCAPRASQR